MYNQDSRKYIGKYVSPTTIHPNSNYKLLYPAKRAEVNNSKILPGNKKIGLKAFVSAIADKEGIRKDLTSLFGEESSNALLDYAMYAIENHSGVTGKAIMTAKYAEKIKWNVSDYIRASEILGITDRATIFKNSKHDSYIHLYFDWKNGGKRAIKFIGDTYAEYDKAMSDVSAGNVPQIDSKFINYLSVKQTDNSY